MSLTVGELNAKLDLDQSRFNAGLGSARGSMMSFGSLAAGAGLAAGAALAGVGVAAGVAAAKGIQEFAGFQQGMNEVFTLLPGISEQAMGDMTGQVQDFAREFGVLPDDVVPALYQSLSAGIPQGNVFEFLETAQKAAKGGVTDLTTAVDGLTSTVNAYGPDALSATDASDLMFTAVRLGKTTMDELASSLFNVNPIAAALGVNFGDVTAALATMTSQGVPTSVATTQLRQLFVELSDAGSEVAGIFEQVAGKSFKDFIAEGGNTQQALALLAEHASDTGVGVNDLFGSVEAGSAALALSGENADSFASNLDEMGDSAGATDEAFQTMNRGLGPIFDRIKANVAVLLLQLGEKLAPIVERVAAGVSSLFAAFQEGGFAGFLDRLRELLAANFGDLFGDVSLQGISASIRTWVEGWLPGALAALGDFFNSLGAWLQENGPGLVNDWLAATLDMWSWVLDQIPDVLSALGTWLSSVLEWLGTTGVPALWTWITETLAPTFWAWLQEVWPPFVAELWVLWGRFSEWLVSDAVPFVRERMILMAGALVDWIWTTAVPWLLANLPVWLAALREWLVSTALPAIKQKAGELALALVDWIRTEGIPQAIIQLDEWKDAVIGWLGRLPGQLRDNMMGIGADIVGGLIDGLLSGFDAVRTVIEQLSFLIPDWAKNVLGISSPSKVMMRLGEYTGEGFMLGVERSMRMPAVDLAGAVATPAGASADSGIFPSEITVVSVLDGREVARSTTRWQRRDRASRN